ncbi:uncharacterized protein LOC111329688 [Stylophora pistillata]|uniref:uncharacterized protein LOC111329688 n=1 Tax=Stylophora pistillata TaxID=50429 RepID=UPI000C04C4D4|nr:uncharacterized protein LOC111329688 [Stylophora pistillata]
MLIKARATTKATKGDLSKGVVIQDQNGDELRLDHRITRVTLRNIFHQIGRKEDKFGNGQSYDQERDAESGSVVRSETESSGWCTVQNAERSSELDERVAHELEAGSKDESEFTSKKTGTSGNQGSGDLQFSSVKGANVAKPVAESARDKPTKGIMKGEGNSGSEELPFDPILLFQVRNIRKNVLKAEKQATMELNNVRKEFRAKMEDLQEDLKMVRKLTSNVHRKVGITVKQALAMARQAKANVTNRLVMALKAATALNNIEKKLGVVHTINASRILRSKIPQFPKYGDVALYQQLLETNQILTKLDGAKFLAVDRAERRFRNEEETGSSITQKVDSLRDELASAEEELSEETDREMEDEREAQEKIQEAVERNKIIAKKTAFALTAIENYLEKLQLDEAKLKRFQF